MGWLRTHILLCVFLMLSCEPNLGGVGVATALSQARATDHGSHAGIHNGSSELLPDEIAVPITVQPQSIQSLSDIAAMLATLPEGMHLTTLTHLAHAVLNPSHPLSHLLSHLLSGGDMEGDMEGVLGDMEQLVGGDVRELERVAVLLEEILLTLDLPEPPTAWRAAFSAAHSNWLAIDSSAHARREIAIAVANAISDPIAREWLRTNLESLLYCDEAVTMVSNQIALALAPVLTSPGTQGVISWLQQPSQSNILRNLNELVDRGGPFGRAIAMAVQSVGEGALRPCVVEEWFHRVSSRVQTDLLYPSGGELWGVVDYGISMDTDIAARFANDTVTPHDRIENYSFDECVQACAATSPKSCNIVQFSAYSGCTLAHVASLSPIPHIAARLSPSLDAGWGGSVMFGDPVVVLDRTGQRVDEGDHEHSLFQALIDAVRAERLSPSSPTSRALSTAAVVTNVTTTSPAANSASLTSVNQLLQVGSGTGSGIASEVELALGVGQVTEHSITQGGVWWISEPELTAPFNILTEVDEHGYVWAKILQQYTATPQTVGFDDHTIAFGDITDPSSEVSQGVVSKLSDEQIRALSKYHADCDGTVDNYRIVDNSTEGHTLYIRSTGVWTMDVDSREFGLTSGAICSLAESPEYPPQEYVSCSGAISTAHFRLTGVQPSGLAYIGDGSGRLMADASVWILLRRTSDETPECVVADFKLADHEMLSGLNECVNAFEAGQAAELQEGDTCDVACGLGYYISGTPAMFSCDDGCLVRPSSSCQPCRSCDAGTYLKGCVTDPGTCQECPQNFYASQPNAHNCTACATCGPGKERVNCGPVSAGQCQDCPSGTYGVDGFVCLDCPAGTFQNATGQNECSDCPVEICDYEGPAHGAYLFGCGGSEMGECTECISFNNGSVCNAPELGAFDFIDLPFGIGGDTFKIKSPDALRVFNKHLRYVRHTDYCDASYGACEACTKCVLWMHLWRAELCIPGRSHCSHELLTCGRPKSSATWYWTVVVCLCLIGVRFVLFILGIITNKTFLKHMAVSITFLYVTDVIEQSYDGTMTSVELAWKTAMYLAVLLCIKYAIRLFFKLMCGIFSGFGIFAILFNLVVLLTLLGMWAYVSCAETFSLVEEYLGIGSAIVSLYIFVIYFLWSLLTAKSCGQLWFLSFFLRLIVLACAFVIPVFYKIQLNTSNVRTVMFKVLVTMGAYMLHVIVVIYFIYALIINALLQGAQLYALVIAMGGGSIGGIAGYAKWLDKVKAMAKAKAEETYDKSGMPISREQGANGLDAVNSAIRNITSDEILDAAATGRETLEGDSAISGTVATGTNTGITISASVSSDPDSDATLTAAPEARAQAHAKALAMAEKRARALGGQALAETMPTLNRHYINTKGVGATAGARHLPRGQSVMSHHPHPDAEAMNGYGSASKVPEQHDPTHDTARGLSGVFAPAGVPSPMVVVGKAEPRD